MLIKEALGCITQISSRSGMGIGSPWPKNKSNYRTWLVLLT